MCPFESHFGSVELTWFMIQIMSMFCNLLCTAICLLPSFVKVACILFHPLCSRATMTGTDVRYIESIKLPDPLLSPPAHSPSFQQFVRSDHLCGLVQDPEWHHADRPIMRLRFQHSPPELERVGRRREENEEVRGRRGRDGKM